MSDVHSYGMTFETGDAVTWLRVARGGYGFSTRVGAVVTKIGASRVQVRTDPAFRGDLKWVDKRNLRLRCLECKEDIAPHLFRGEHICASKLRQSAR